MQDQDGQNIEITKAFNVFLRKYLLFFNLPANLCTFSQNAETRGTDGGGEEINAWNHAKETETAVNTSNLLNADRASG